MSVWSTIRDRNWPSECGGTRFDIECDGAMIALIAMSMLRTTAPSKIKVGT